MSVFETEINSVSNNPNRFEGSDTNIFGANFYGQPLALDFLVDNPDLIPGL